MIYTEKDFIQLVRDMRTAQKRYFATRSKEALIASKELEKKVDAIVYPPARENNGIDPNYQLSL